MKKLILVFALFLSGCGDTLKQPLTIERVHFNPDGQTCWIALEPAMRGWGVTWVQASAENCQYKKGDILK